ncbi:MAG TPA: LacI family DNA-binding transcriptional regulator [Chloroflexia bacterium]|nr:LacI family DNA-binding transcriptional regulator [Chloroflexia bacterium]
MTAGYPRNLAGRRLPLNEIAVRAGVSISTVSRVLNNKAHTISDEVQQRVLSAVSEINPNNAVLKKKLEHVGLFSNRLIDTSIEPFHFGIMAGIQAECQRQSIHFSFTLLKPELETATFIQNKVKQNYIDGLIFMAVDNRVFLENVLQLGLPSVLINSRHLDLPVDTFLPDNMTGTTLAIQYLLAKGHRRILHLTDLRRGTIRTRHLGYRATLEDAGVEYDPSLVVIAADVGATEAYEAMKKFLASTHPDFTAIFCANDMTAIGVMKALREAGLNVPNDVSIVGFDDIAIAEFTDPALTTIRVEREAIGAKALQGLINRAGNTEQLPYTLEVACKLVERDSVVSLPHQEFLE